jgi:glutathione synthase/RimK-type ligase-like ATP-grasp enzyme
MTGSCDVHFAFLTSALHPALYEDDLLAVRALEARGSTVAPVRWDTTTREQLEGFDVVVMRSPWDWFTRRDEFRAFLTMLHELKTRVVNAPAVLSAFGDKRYLATLQASGVPVVPTVVLAPDELHRVPAELRARGWAQAVLKPAFTAAAFDATRVAVDQPEAPVVPTLAPSERWILQPFMRSITEAGEWSFLFFGGQFSHAVKKQPKQGDWRVQSMHGGQSTPVEAPSELISQATSILERAAPETTYARVDGVVEAGTLLLMELEVVEPELFLRFSPQAPQRFADALLAAR